LFLVCSNRDMTDRPSSWRMPTRKQIEKLAATATARGNVPPTGTPGPGDEMPPEYWQAVLEHVAADGGPPAPRSGRSGCPMYNDICCGSPAAAAAAPSKSRRQMPSAYTAPRPSGRPSGNACSTTPVSSGPAGTKKTAAGLRSSSRRRAGPLSASWMAGWRRNIIPCPCPAATVKP
jgi:hypothetical protein